MSIITSQMITRVGSSSSSSSSSSSNSSTWSHMISLDAIECVATNVSIDVNRSPYLAVPLVWSYCHRAAIASRKRSRSERVKERISRLTYLGSIGCGGG